MTELLYGLFDVLWIVCIVLIAGFILLTFVASCEYNPWLQETAARQRRHLLRGLDAAIDIEAPQW